MPKDSANQIDVARLRDRLREKPRTKAGQVRQAWPHIKALFEAGHSLKDICTWLNESGVVIGYARLSHYVGRLRRAEQAAAVTVTNATTPLPELPAEPDPLENITERQSNRPGFQFNSEPDLKKLI